MSRPGHVSPTETWDTQSCQVTRTGFRCRRGMCRPRLNRQPPRGGFDLGPETARVTRHETAN